MLGNLFSILLGAIFFILLLSSGSYGQSSIEASMEPDDSTFIESVDFMFPENFLERYPHEANPYRLKIFTYLIFNLLVKGYGSIDPEKAWSSYNRDDYHRVLIDAVFYEYYSNIKDSQNEDFVSNLSDNFESDLLVDNKEIAIDRIGQYLDHLSETESKPKRLEDVYEILSAQCEMQTWFAESSGKPGTDYPNFCDIPETSFSCHDKRIPGIYADFETGCQAFHVCWPHRLDSFLCPIGTIFNQSLLTCDTWHATGCYSSPQFFERDQFVMDGIFTELDVPEFDGSCQSLLNKHLQLHLKFLPAKCKIADLVDGKKEKAKSEETDVGDIQMRIEMVKEMLSMVRGMLSDLREIKKELADEMKNRGTPWIHVLAKNSEQRFVSKPSTETINETSEFTRKIGETDFKTLKNKSHSRNSGKPLSVKEPKLFRTRSTQLKPSKYMDVHIKDYRRQDVPEIVRGSLRLGANILNGDLLSLAKQVMIDSYRKIEL